MMFPSQDPLAYPNQPMLTLEQASGFDPALAPHQYGSERSGAQHDSDPMDVQLFGEMPIYMHQHEIDITMGEPRPDASYAPEMQGQMGTTGVDTSWDMYSTEDWDKMQIQ